jgi:hypothetical protein
VAENSIRTGWKEIFEVSRSTELARPRKQAEEEIEHLKL